MKISFQKIAVILLFVFGMTTAAEFKAVVDDVVTDKVVAIKISSGTVPSGSELIVRRDGREVARLRLKTATGICRVVSGSPLKGDWVGLAEETKKPDVDSTNPDVPTSQNARVGYAYSGNDPAEESLCRAEGGLIFAAYLLKTGNVADANRAVSVAKDVNDRLQRVQTAKTLLGEGDAKDRVRGALVEMGEIDLAARVAPGKATTASPPILPKTSMSYPVHPFGGTPMLTTNLSAWKTPAYWGEPPINPNFDRWRFDAEKQTIQTGTDALVRTDVALEDLAISGEVKILSGRSVYLILRSQAVVKFNHEFAPAGVSFKSGYDNLSRHTLKSGGTALELDRWYAFKVTLKGSRLTVLLDGETAVDATVSFKTEVKPDARYVGLGAYKGKGVFRNVRIDALTPRDKRTLPIFVEELQTVPSGKPVAMLADGGEFASLYGTRVQSHRNVHHAVDKGLLRITGSSFHQFTLKNLAADAFKASGNMRIMDEGNVWFRINPNLAVGISAAKKRGDRDADEPAFYLKRRLGNYQSYEQGFSGTPLIPGQWYEWQIDYVHPNLTVSINGDVVAMACTDKTGPLPDGFNHFGISAYNVKAEFKKVTFQRLEPAQKAATAAEIETVVKAAVAHVDKAVAALGTRKGGETARSVLDGTRPPVTASSDDFATVAKALREDHDWPMYLALLEADFKRFPANSKERTASETRWRTAQQKFDLAQEALEPGDLGLDNVVKLAAKGTAVAAARGGGVWFHLAGANAFKHLDTHGRDTVKTIPFADDVVRLADRGDELIVLTGEGSRFVKIDLKTGKETKRLDVPSGKVVDWTDDADGRSYFSVNENKPGEIVFAKYAVYAFDETAMTIRKTDAFGQYLALDPYGRYLYTGFAVVLARTLGAFNPSPFRIQPVGAYVDHLACYRIVANELSLFTQRAAPGTGGVGLAASPRGKGICYLAKNGFQMDRDQTLTGMRVPIFRAGRVGLTIDSLDCGKRPMLMAFNPTRVEAYVYNGRDVGIFELKTHDRVGTLKLPTKCANGSGTRLIADARGDRLYLAYSGNPGGVVVLPLMTDDETRSFESPMEGLERAKTLLAQSSKKAAMAALRTVVEDSPFTTTGEAAAELWLKERAVSLTDRSAPALEGVAPLETYLAAPVPKTVELPKQPGATPHRPAVSKESQARLDDLSSFESLAKAYPASWTATGLIVLDAHPDDPEILLMMAERAIALGSTRMAHDFAMKLLSIADKKGYYAMRAYGVIARASEGLSNTIHALNLAETVAPRNPFVHRRLSEAYTAAEAEGLANYHARLSLLLFPSQPKLQKRLESAGVLKPRPIPAEREIADLYKTLSPSTALIRHPSGVGTGFFITRDGLLLTNHHVIAGRGDSAPTVHLVDPQGKTHKLPAVVVASDSRLDIAILSVNLGVLSVEPMELAPDDLAKTGMRTIAIGNPGMGSAVLTQTVTEGIISNVNQRVDGQFYIQTSAAVNPGNSGGPLISRHGLVLGMVTLKASLDNVGFAIPAKRLKAFLEASLD